MSLTISQISGFLTRHNCNPFDCQWSYSLDPLGSYQQLPYLFTIFTTDTYHMGSKYVSIVYKVLTCLQLSQECKFVIPRDTFVMLED